MRKAARKAVRAIGGKRAVFMRLPRRTDVITFKIKWCQRSTGFFEMKWGWGVGKPVSGSYQGIEKGGETVTTGMRGEKKVSGVAMGGAMVGEVTRGSGQFE
jgi:hypothetical protein